MNSGEATPRTPDLSQRLVARPAGRPVMYQQWRDLLFLHWEYSVATIQATLPEGRGFPSAVSAVPRQGDGVG